MSKHIFEQTLNNQTYEVQIGWDKPLQRYYGVISPWVEDHEYEEGGYFDTAEPVWSNLYFAHDVSLEDIVTACEELVLTLPNGLLDNVVNDRLRNAVNEVTVYEQSNNHPTNTEPSTPQPE